MARLYLILIILGVLGSIGAGAFWYYKNTQERIAILQENNAKLEVALETSQASIESLQQALAKINELNNKLQADLQKAEAYGDDLRAKLRKHNLTALALKNAKELEGKMNGATANLWRGFMEDSGNTDVPSLPSWLQPFPAGTGDKGSNQNREDIGTNNPEAEASTTR